MTTGPLDGHGILVTRPAEQADELAEAIEAAGGIALRMPLLEIAPRNEADITAEVADMAPPDVVIYVSPNAVRHGFAWHPNGALTAAIGPATQAELKLQGLGKVICPRTGYDSESLLADKALTDVSGKTIRIIRGQDGREMLGITLGERGARVDHLATYLRRARHVPDSEIRQFENLLRRGEISCITVMSDATLHSLLENLPAARRDLLRQTRLVTPSNRVLKNIAEQMPGLIATLAPGPRPDDMILGLSACLSEDNSE
jgi:uroporphyrinogen-III synthase